MKRNRHLFSRHVSKPLESGTSSSQWTCPSRYHEELETRSSNKSWQNCRLKCKATNCSCFMLFYFGLFTRITTLIYPIRYAGGVSSSRRPKDSILNLSPWIDLPVFCSQVPPLSIYLWGHVLFSSTFGTSLLFCGISHFSMAVLKSNIQKSVKNYVSTMCIHCMNIKNSFRL